MTEKNKYGFANTNPTLEEYLRDPATMRWGGLTGRGLKQYMKSGARAAADDFARSPGTADNRAFFRSCLEGSGINYEVAAEIAETSEVIDPR